jgi:hypothetical protein
MVNEDGRTVSHARPTYKPVRTSRLDFDPNNPRFGGGTHSLSQDQLQQLLEKAPHYAREVVPSLVENGFIPYEPLVVRQDGERYVVIEGNRRLAAVRYIINNPDEFSEQVRKKFRRLPSLVFPSAATETSHDDAVRVYLGVHHLFGFREWPPESKAKFLDQNIKTKKDLQKLAREIGIQVNEFERYLIPYRLRKKAQKSVGSVAVKDFWTLAEAMNRAAIKEYINLETDDKTLDVLDYDPRKLKFLLGFLYGTDGIEKRIEETRQIKTLAKVLGSKRASDALEKGASLEVAMLYVQPKKKTSLDLAEKLESLLKRILKLRPQEPEVHDILEILENYEEKLRILIK